MCSFIFSFFIWAAGISMWHLKLDEGFRTGAYHWPCSLLLTEGSLRTQGVSKSHRKRLGEREETMWYQDKWKRVVRVMLLWEEMDMVERIHNRYVLIRKSLVVHKTQKLSCSDSLYLLWTSSGCLSPPGCWWLSRSLLSHHTTQLHFQTLMLSFSWQRF